jgi:hypothetical protein
MRPTLLLFALTACLPTFPARAQQPRIVLLDTAVLAAPRLEESSGVAPSRLRPGIYWTHNDSGDEPILYATDSAGTDLGFVRLAPARAVDWEDMSPGPCLVVPGHCLYVGDIGDNAARRGYVVVYRLREPEPPTGPGDTARVVSVLDSIVLRYPDRPHDAEALAVTPGGDLLLITKDRTSPPVLFRATAPPRNAIIVLERLAQLDIAFNPLLGRMVTGAAVSPDGTMLAVRTYVSLHLLRLKRDGRIESLTLAQGVPLPAVEAQGEAITFDGPARLVLTSERGVLGRALITRLSIIAPP